MIKSSLMILHTKPVVFTFMSNPPNCGALIITTMESFIFSSVGTLHCELLRCYVKYETDEIVKGLDVHIP